MILDITGYDSRFLILPDTPPFHTNTHKHVVSGLEANQGMFEKQMEYQIYRLIIGQNCMRNPKNALIFYIEQPRLVKIVTEVSTITEPDTKIKVRACIANTLLSESTWKFCLRGRPRVRNSQFFSRLIRLRS